MTEQKTTSGAKVGKKKIKRNVPQGKCYISAGFGNVIVTMTDPNGDTVAWSSAGALGFKGSRKGTPFAAQMAAEDAAKKAMEAGMRAIEIFLSGPGAGREPAIRALAAMGMKIISMQDITPIPHNGCRPPKRRRI
ncbi:MAG: 30S ribosomal protein S11 [Bdellovibrionaceae bacterium]|nr:30S ribosomal protein S11 [Pseudobdellovibrionaceae bacterium]